MTSETKSVQLHQSWLDMIGDEFSKPYMTQLRAFLLDEKRLGQTVYPPGHAMFNAMNTTPFDRVKVVILGQDPYHGPNQAHGLSFSVLRGVRPPPSLVNIYKELQQSLNIQPVAHGELTSWAEQGVLLLNTTLSVRRGQPKSHAGKGWETFTDRIIAELNKQREGLVFMLWGRHAGEKAGMIDGRKHLVLKSAHPSPFSADRGFFGCGHFVKANQYLGEQGKEPINWQLPQ